MTDGIKEKKIRRALEGVQALAEYRAETEAKLKNIARLKAERIAREIVKPVPVEKKTVVKKRK
jgi:hypothetical protein